MGEFGPIPCNLCGSEDFTLFAQAPDRYVGGPGEFTYVRCRGCGLVYMNPRIGAEALADYYPEDYGAFGRGAGRERPGKSFGRRLERRAKELGGRALAFLGADHLFYARANDLPSAAREGLGPASRVVDVGCGSGSLLARLVRETGCRAVGVDPSAHAAAAAWEAHRVEVIVGTLAEAHLKEGAYDLAILRWSLEHAPDPGGLLREVARALRPGGRVVVGVPNADGLVARLFRSRWYHLDPPRHLHLFTPATLRRYFAQAGLEVLALYHDTSLWGLKGSIQYALHGKHYRLGGVPRLRFPRPLGALLRSLTILLALFRRSDVILALGRRPAASPAAPP